MLSIARRFASSHSLTLGVPSLIALLLSSTAAFAFSEPQCGELVNLAAKPFTLHALRGARDNDHGGLGEGYFTRKPLFGFQTCSYDSFSDLQIGLSCSSSSVKDYMLRLQGLRACLAKAGWTEVKCEDQSQCASFEKGADKVSLFIETGPPANSKMIFWMLLNDLDK